MKARDYTAIDECIKQHPSWNDFQKHCPEKLTVWNFYQRKKFLGLTKKIGQSKKSLRKGSDVDKMYNFLLSYPQGIRRSEISVQLKMTGKRLSNILYGLKQKVGPKNLTKKGDVITLKQNSGVPALVQVQTTLQKVNGNGTHLNGHLSEKAPVSLKRVSSLMNKQAIPASDVNDYLEMVKKSLYYQMSAEAILTSNEIVEEMRQHLTI